MVTKEKDIFISIAYNLNVIDIDIKILFLNLDYPWEKGRKECLEHRIS